MFSSTMARRIVFLVLLFAGSIALTLQTSTTTAEPEPETTPQPETTFISVPESEQEPTTTPETSYPETSPEPEFSTPESGSEPSTPEPEAEASPETEPESETTTSEPAPETPGTPEPETAAPETPGTPESESPAPETPSPETPAPETPAPETPSSESAAPETAAPETESEPQTSTPEAGSEPESSTTDTSSSPEPESGPVASSPESGPETEPQLSSPATPETESESEPGLTSPEPESGISSPETEPEPSISNSGVSSSPETGSEPEGPSAEHEQISPEPETPNPESGSEPETSASPESSGEPETTKSEPEVILPGATGEPEKIAQAEVRPSAAEIVIPPFMLMMVIVLGLLGLLARTRYTIMKKSSLTFSRSFIRNVISNSSKFASLQKNTQLQMFDVGNNNEDDKETLRSEDSFFTPFDFEVMDSLKYSYNRPKELFTIALPALLSLALCPLTLYLYEPVTKFLWSVEEYPVKPDINDAIACFLAPAGLVYATSFGFAFQSAISKQHEILMKMTEEISMIDQIATFTAKLNLPSQKLRMEVYRAIKTEAIFMILQILDRDVHTYKNKAPHDLKVRIWSVLDTLRTVNTSKNNYVDRCLSEKIMCHIMKLNSICSDRMGVLHARIHPVKWMFLETLGFFSFVGILLLNAYSYKMELVMCIITVFSISMLCYVVSDLDSPFSGFFRVDLSVMYEVIERLSAMHELAKLGETGFIFYPERGNGKGTSTELSRPSTAEIVTDKIIKDCW